MLRMCCQIGEDVFLICLCFVYLHVFCYTFALVGHHTNTVPKASPEVVYWVEEYVSEHMTEHVRSWWGLFV